MDIFDNDKKNLKKDIDKIVSDCCFQKDSRLSKVAEERAVKLCDAFMEKFVLSQVVNGRLINNINAKQRGLAEAYVASDGPFEEVLRLYFFKADLVLVVLLHSFLWLYPNLSKVEFMFL